MAEGRKACDVRGGCPLVLIALLEKSPSPRAVSIDGRRGARDDDSHVVGLEVDIRVGPHIGVRLISEIIVGMQM